jgi:hypothetical protein
MSQPNFPTRSTARGLRSGIRARLVLAAGATVGVLVGVHHVGATRTAHPPVAAAPATPATPVPAPATGGPAAAPDDGDHAAGQEAHPAVPVAPVATLRATALPAVVSAPSPRPPRPPVTVVRAVRPGGVRVEPPAIVESIDTGSPFSPLVTFTVENTGEATALVGRATTTTPAFRITDDGCSGRTLATGDICHVTVQFQPPAPGHYRGTLLLPVDGTQAAAASLEGDAH